MFTRVHKGGRREGISGGRKLPLAESSCGLHQGARLAPECGISTGEDGPYKALFSFRFSTVLASCIWKPTRPRVSRQRQSRCAKLFSCSETYSTKMQAARWLCRYYAGKEDPHGWLPCSRLTLHCLEGTGHKRRSQRGRGSSCETGPFVLFSIGAYAQRTLLPNVSEHVLSSCTQQMGL